MLSRPLPHSQPSPVEPLHLSAPLARKLALELCRRDPASGRSCEWLHGFWQCLRIVGLAADPGRHAVFYGEALGSVQGPRLIVSGAADYSMPAHALCALRAAQITVIDTCDTPLELNRWYAQHVGCELQTHRGSILDYSPPAPFDAICTHSFLGMFTPQQRPRVVTAWRRLLRPRGILITAHPLRPSGADEPNRFSAEQAASFRAAIAAKAHELARLLECSEQDVMQQAEAYLGARYGYPVRSLDELRQLFEDGGFELAHLEPFTPAPGATPETGGPGLRNAAVRYAHVIAARRQSPRR